MQKYKRKGSGCLSYCWHVESTLVAFHSLYTKSTQRVRGLLSPVNPAPLAETIFFFVLTRHKYGGCAHWIQQWSCPLVLDRELGVLLLPVFAELPTIHECIPAGIDRMGPSLSRHYSLSMPVHKFYVWGQVKGKVVWVSVPSLLLVVSFLSLPMGLVVICICVCILLLCTAVVIGVASSVYIQHSCPLIQFIDDQVMGLLGSLNTEAISICALTSQYSRYLSYQVASYENCIGMWFNTQCI